LLLQPLLRTESRLRRIMLACWCRARLLLLLVSLVWLGANFLPHARKRNNAAAFFQIGNQAPQRLRCRFAVPLLPRGLNSPMFLRAVRCRRVVPADELEHVARGGREESEEVGGEGVGGFFLAMYKKIDDACAGFWPLSVPQGIPTTSA
jgi:hypothetical protein